MVDNCRFITINGIKIQASSIKSVQIMDAGSKRVKLKNGLSIEIGQGEKPENAVIMTDYLGKNECKMKDEDIDFYNRELDFTKKEGKHFDTHTFVYNLPASVKIKGGEKNDCIFLRESACQADFTQGGLDCILWDEKGAANISNDVIDVSYTGFYNEGKPYRTWLGMDGTRDFEDYFFMEEYEEDLNNNGQIDKNRLDKDLKNLFYEADTEAFKEVFTLEKLLIFASKLNDLMQKHGIDNQQYLTEIRNEIQKCEKIDEYGAKSGSYPKTLNQNLITLVKKLANAE